MKKERNKKPRSLAFRIFIFLCKIPLIILVAGLGIKSKEDDDSSDPIMQNPSLYDSRQLKDIPPHER